MGNPVTNLDEAEAEYNRTYAYTGDATGQMCQDFIDVCGWIIGFRPANSLTSQRADTRFQTQFDVKALLALQQQAQRWLNNLQQTGSYEANAVVRARLKRTFDISGVRNDG